MGCQKCLHLYMLISDSLGGVHGVYCKCYFKLVVRFQTSGACKNDLYGQNYLFQEFCANPRALVARLWDEVADSFSRWELNNKDNAVKAFELKNGIGETTKCGLFINRVIPFFAVSPDRIYKDYLIVVKCPHVLRNKKPSDLHKLSVPEQQTHFNFKNEKNEVKLKREHEYYAQCQLQESTPCPEPAQNKKTNL